MLPDPKKVAQFINRTLFKSAEERRQEDETNRDVQIRLGKARIRRHITHQQEMVARLTALAKRALAIHDEAHFRQVGRQLLWSWQDIQRWEQYLLSLEVLEARRDQVRASVDLLQSVKAMSESLGEMAGPQQIADLQRQMEEGLARASSLEERLQVMMEVMDSALSTDMQVDEGALDNLKTSLTEDVVQSEAAAFDREIEDGLRKIREELEKQGK
jgi:hypothetical protein